MKNILFTLYLFMPFYRFAFSQECRPLSFQDLTTLHNCLSNDSNKDDCFLFYDFTKINYGFYAKCRRPIELNIDASVNTTSPHHMISVGLSGFTYMTYDKSTYVMIKNQAKKTLKKIIDLKSYKNLYEDGFTNGKVVFLFKIEVQEKYSNANCFWIQVDTLKNLNSP